MKREEIARAKLAKLEADPKHIKRTPETDAQTRNDDMSDPKYNKKDGQMDNKWFKDKNGNMTHPDFEG